MRRFLAAAILAVLITPANASCSDWFITPQCGAAGLEIAKVNKAEAATDFSARKRKKYRRYRSYDAPLFSNLAGRVPPRNARCGYYMRAQFGGRYGPEFNLAQNWCRKLSCNRSPAVGKVVVWTRGGNRGHVAKIVSLIGPCRAVVHDNKGTYTRDICRRVIGYASA